MPRPIEFDRDRARNAAMKLFWRQGYTATSLAQLLESMKIGRSSFYAAFTDKRSLFIECLELFAERTREILEQGHVPQQPLETARAFFENTTFAVPRWRVDAGCMMVNTILELSDVDADLSRRATVCLARIEQTFVWVFEHHVDDPRQAASVVMTLNKGIRVSSRARASEAELRQVISSTLSLLDRAA